ncbi:MAG: hypothetical protein ABIQ49_09615 [Gemmatimonadales bacterium]
MPGRAVLGRPALRSALLFGALMAPVLSPARLPGQAAPLSIAPLRGHLYLVTGPGGNSLALTGPDGVMLIDQQFPSPTPTLTRLLGSVTREPLRYVLRAGWAEPPRDASESWSHDGALVVTHEDVRDRQTRVRPAAAGPPGLAGPTGAGEGGGLGPDIAFSEVIAFAIDGEDVHAVHFGGAYAKGDALVHLHGLNTIYAGAMFTTDGYPAIDVDEGGSIDGLVTAAVRLIAATGRRTVVVPGRGPLSDRSGLAAYHAMLVDVRERVRKGIAAGRSLTQVLASRPTAAFDRRWGRGAVSTRQFVEMVYRSLAAAS